MTRAGSKLVLRTSPAPGHYLCIKWDFARCPLAQCPGCVLRANFGDALGIRTAHANARGSRVQRLVAKTVDVERETALVVGSDNVLLGFRTHVANIQANAA